MGMDLSVIGRLSLSHSYRPPPDRRSDEPLILLDQRPCARTPLEISTNLNSGPWALGVSPSVISIYSTPMGTTSALS